MTLQTPALELFEAERKRSTRAPNSQLGYVGAMNAFLGAVTDRFIDYLAQHPEIPKSN